LRLSTTGIGLGVIVSVGSGVNVKVGRRVSVGERKVAVSEEETLVDELLTTAVGEPEAPCPGDENVQESVVIIKRRRRYPSLLLIRPLYYCRSLNQ